MVKKFWHLQKDANLSNKECAEWLGVTTRSIVKWRKSDPDAPNAVIIALKYRIKYGKNYESIGGKQPATNNEQSRDCGVDR